ncbi:SMAD/FHA [Glarea lozoyensis ATCC 20868]|uniref:RING-type E3 ubiquitin transferase n=1 Tax=Glarea lozoyensis (strain ATCC 20868 / MF5171) TaxID=1116229 RepID=S3E8P0_GLAL2|nr:SMAD/FHA [Glarea lozoyensis ATCC 20868]EPE34668.1 SMAD/FHA [Glarea lozoyensis ATCC 20868]
MYSSSIPSPPWHPGPNLDRTPPSPPLTSPASPSRTSRLRALSYLRSYTQSHILSRDSHSGSNTPTRTGRPGVARASSYPSPSPSPAAAATPAASSTPLQHQLSRQTSPTAQRATITADVTSPDSHASSTDNLGETSGWLPTVGGLSAVSRVASEPQSTATASSSAVLAGNDPATGSTATNSMARTRAATIGADIPEGSEAQRNQAPGQNGTTKGMAHQLPSIRFLAHQDPRATRPSLAFQQMARILPTGTETIKVGRYSEKDTQPSAAANVPSAAPVGFKSKVVSRRHCEFWCKDGRWFIRDVKSSSGTFLNHIRLSSPGTESKPYPVNDGDIVQLGIDFKGGEEMIFRCVKIRVELNKGWQVGPSSFNVQSHKRLRELNNLGKSTGGGSSQDCAICLGPIAPCQSLFVAPCSHTWHYKCIRVIINGPHWPHFICPNCRSVADLEAELDDPSANAEDSAGVEDDGGNEINHGVGLSGQEYDELMHRLEGEPQEVKEAVLQATTRRLAHEPLEEVEAAALEAAKRRHAERSSGTTTAQNASEETHDEEPDLEIGDSNEDSDSNPENGVHHMTDNMQHLNVDAAPSPVESESHTPLISNSTVPPVDIVSRGSISNGSGRQPTALSRPNINGRSSTRTPSPNGTSSSLDVVLTGTEGPMTPRNDAGPFIFDGSAGRLSDARPNSVNLAAATQGSIS